MQWAQSQLAQSAMPTSPLDAELLLAFVLDKPRSFVRARPEQLVSGDAAVWFVNAIEQRRQGMPVAYLTGQREFWSLSLRVSPMTLIPRPETELIVETLLRLFPDPNAALRLADLGTGSGAIALALASERPAAQIIATDQSAEALAIAKQNAGSLGLPNVQFHQGDWCDALPCGDFDAIVSNPPYLAETEWADFEAGLAYEPREALVSGDDGLTAIRMIIQQVAQVPAPAHCHPREGADPLLVNFLKPGGYLVLEHGYQQAPAVRQLLESAGFQNIQSFQDLAGIERVTLGTLSPA